MGICEHYIILVLFMVSKAILSLLLQKAFRTVACLSQAVVGSGGHLHFGKQNVNPMIFERSTNRKYDRRPI
jgi:hypothetical protein